jgi:methionine-R-sulfoxide reductase
MLDWNAVLRFAAEGNPQPARRVEKTAEEWRQALTPQQFAIAREAGTEMPFSSDSCNRFEPGRYACVCCGSVLFDAATKFDSGTGWPSFDQPIAENAVAYRADDSHGMRRIEAICNTCDAHLGHVFPDGPPPSGLRYCMNALSLRKVEEQTPA